MKIIPTLRSIPFFSKLFSVRRCITIRFFRNDPESGAFMVYIHHKKRAEFIRLSVINDENQNFTADIPSLNVRHGFLISYTDIKDSTGNGLQGPIRELFVSSNLGTERYRINGHLISRE